MMMTVEHSMLAPSFAGIYRPPEAARYLKAADSAKKAYLTASSSTLTRWTRRWLASPDLAGVRGAGLTLTFEDLVSMRVIAALRSASVGWTEIKNFERRLSETARSRNPFASESLWRGLGRLYEDLKSRLASAGRKAFDILRRNLIPEHGLAFGEDSCMAVSWTPAKGVSLHPEIQFGAPCIENTRIPTGAIYGMVKAGDSPRFAAKAYGISIGSVEAALDWEHRLDAA